MNEPLGFDCFTARYARFGGAGVHLKTGERVTPVRTSIGNPRWVKGAGAWERADLLVPWGLVGVYTEKDEYMEHYRARLEKAGAAKIRSQLRAIWHKTGEQPLALLCFEDLDKQWCHRRMFAAWWLEKTGEEIHELFDERHVEQLSLA